MYQAIVLSELSQETQFFTKGHHDREKIKALVLECYQAIVDQEAADTIPTLAHMQSYLMSYFLWYTIERYLLFPDEEHDDLFDTANQVRELYQESDLPLENFVDWFMEESSGMSSINQELQKKFMLDVCMFMNEMALRFHNLSTSYEFNQAMLSERTEFSSFKGVIDYEVNAPICEVW